MARAPTAAKTAKGQNAKAAKAQPQGKRETKQQGLKDQLLQKKRSNSSLLAPAEKKKTRDIDVEVLRTIGKHIPSPSDALLYGHVVDGKTMVEFVTEEWLLYICFKKY